MINGSTLGSQWWLSQDRSENSSGASGSVELVRIELTIVVYYDGTSPRETRES